jgi:tetratricopeptide (TPR) repeat protein
VSFPFCFHKSALSYLQQNGKNRNLPVAQKEGSTSLLIVQRRAVQLSDALQWESKATEFVLESKPEDAEGAFRNSLEIRRRYLDGEPPAPSTTRMVLDCLTTHDKLNVANELLDQILTPSVLSRQEYSDLCRYRAELCGRLGQWRAAAAMAIGFLNHQPEDHLAYHTLAPLYVVTTNLEAYHQLCLRIVSTFSNTTDLFIADRMAKDCLILPSAGVDLQLVAAMAQLAVVKGKGNETEFFFLSCDALAQYRLGNYEKSLDQANRTILFKNDMARAEAFAVMAMAQYRLGNVATALQALTNCNETIENKLAKIGQPPGPDWRDWIIARALRSEAESLIKPELWMRIEERGRLALQPP